MSRQIVDEDIDGRFYETQTDELEKEEIREDELKRNGMFLKESQEPILKFNTKPNRIYRVK